MKTYRRHNCERSHRTYLTFAKCVFPRAIWIEGEGPWAVLAWCGRGPTRSTTLTVTLWATGPEANEALGPIDSSGCGGGCTGRHEIILLEKP